MNILGDEPPYLTVGTEVSAKYKGAFCEAKVHKVDRVVKCKIAFKLGFGSHTVLDNQVKGILRVGASVEARHPDKKEFVEGTITKIQDCSQYTVVFDDGDITTLRRTALCLKSGRHFAESETLDQLPLTHPEHFGNPVVSGRRGTRRKGGDESSGDEESPKKSKRPAERETEIGKIVCVELGDKKKVKDNWFPGLVVAPNAQDAVRIRVTEEYLVRSFKDGRYYTVPRKEATEFTREIGRRVDGNTLKTAVEKALTFLDKDELPPHWDRDLLFGLLDTDGSDSDGAMESDSSDDEPREEKDHFVAQLYKFMDDRGTPINNCPSVSGQDLDLYKLFKVVNNLNGYNRVSNQNQWKIVSSKLGLGVSPNIVTQVKHAYKKFLHSFEDFYRKLGCTMVNHPRSSRPRVKGGRPLIRDRDRATPVHVKTDPSSTHKREEENLEGFTANTPVVKKIVGKEEVTRGRGKPEEVKEDPPKDRPMSSLRKKFPTLKASPRTKEVAPPAPPPMPTPLKRLPSKRTKRPLREHSVDDGRTSGDETVRLIKAPEEQQRSTTRSRSSKEELKLPTKKEAADVPRSSKVSIKTSDSESAKKSKSSVDEIKKGKEVEKRARRGGSEDSASAAPSPSISTSVAAAAAAALAAATAKKNRKRRNTDVTTDEPVNRPCIPKSRTVLVGDILKVYYGAEPNAIYEAKVIDIEVDDSGEQAFLVHYAGWNSRYDEWVKRSKIAENLSRTVRKNNNSPARSVKAQAVKKKMASGNGSKAESARSTTPSSITSSSSRTKSPATPISLSRRSKRHETPMTTGLAPSRRPRRLSGHTDPSIDTDSDSESVNSESDSEVKSYKNVSDGASVSDDSRKREPKKIEAKPPAKRKTVRKPVDKPSSSPTEVVEKKKPRLAKAIKAEKVVVKEVSVVMEEAVSDADVKSESEIPKGTEFDLNEIRSELKGIDKAVKVNSDLQAVAADIEVPTSSSSTQLDVRLSDVEEIKVEENEVVVNLPGTPVPISENVNVEEPTSSKSPMWRPEELGKTPLQVEDIKEDIYEFKEPEPFDFQEVRRPIRVFDEPIERSPEKSLPVKKVSVVNPSMKAVVEKVEGTDVALDVDGKSRFRKTVTKKLKEVVEQETRGDDEKNEDLSPVKEAPKLEPEELPPPILSAPMVEEEMDVEPSSPSHPPHKSSPEPPCLEPVLEASPFRPPEESPILTREEPPRLDSDISSSDSESEERLVIVNEEEFTSNETKREPQLVPPPQKSPITVPDSTTLPSTMSPPLLLVEAPHDGKPSPISETRFKHIEEHSRTSPAALSPQRVIINEDVDEIPKKEEILKDEMDDDDGEEGSLRSLICDEVIPGSPAPKDAGDELAFPVPSGSGGVMDTPPVTPPTTPESNMSSPREDRVGSSSLDNESSKSLRDSCERDMEIEGQRNRMKYGRRSDKDPFDSPTKKKRRSRKRSESGVDALKRNCGRGSRVKMRDASDSDDSDSSYRIRPIDPLLSSRSPRPSKYNFLKEMGPDLDANQRIQFLQNQMQELRKAYMTVKSQLASIDRRRKKLRRKEREEKAEKAAAAAAAARLQETSCA